MADVQTYRDPPAPGPILTQGGPLSYIHWGPGIAGAIVAAATSFVLMGFASAVGLMVASPSPTWRDASVWLAILSGFWLYWRYTGGFSPEGSRTHAAMAFGTGGIIAVLAFLIGALMISRIRIPKL